MKKIIVTEKPSVARTFAEVLHVKGNHDGYIENEEWIITWCVGHLVTLSYPERYDESYKEWKEETLPFLPSKYKYEVIEDVKKQFNVIKKLYNRSDVNAIYYAGDPGREGIYIQALVRSLAGCKQGIDEKVVWIDSQTELEIKRGIREAKPYSAYRNLINSGYERAVEDYASGINLSRMLSIRYGRYANQYAAAKKYRPVAVGRVMTCVLGMIVSREREIENFKVTPFYKIESNVNGIDAEWKAIQGSRMFQSPLLYNDTGFKEENDAQRFMQSLPSSVTIEKIEKKTEKKFAPKLFNLAELQSECTKQFKMSPDQTLEVAQLLYEKKLTTYPRTDSRVLSSAIAEEIRKNIAGIANGYEGDCKSVATQILSSNYSSIVKNIRYTDDSKVTDHYAIIPTGSGFGNISSLSERERNVYELVVKRFLSIFLPAAEYLTVKLIEDAGGEKFFATAKALQSPGYLLIAGIPSKENTPDISVFSSLIEGRQYPVSYSVKKGETAPPKRYTSGSMILAMENAGNLIEDDELRAQIKGSGIGTSATRAETIKKLVKNEYILLNSKTQVLTPAPLGNIIYEIVNDTIPDLLNPRMTASWEKGLESIAEGKIDATDYRKKMEDYIRREVNAIKTKTDDGSLLRKLDGYKSKNAFVSEELSAACPICGANVKTTSYGCVCTSYKKDATDTELRTKQACKFGIGQIAGKTLSSKNMSDLITRGNTEEIKGFKSKSGKSFAAKLKMTLIEEDGITKPKIEFEFTEPKESNISCPTCNNPLVKDKWNFSCSCGYKISHFIAKKDIPDEEIKRLIAGERTNLIKGFISKNGKRFNAYLKINPEGTIEFEFENQR